MKLKAAFGLFKNPFNGSGYRAGFLSLLICLGSCTTTPKGNRDVIVNQQATKVDTALFSHHVFYKQGKGNALLIFIHGDGLPWLGKGVVANDPTPYYSVAWSLFKRTQAHALFITRPCYFGVPQRAACEPKYWTYARYSQGVINSLYEALTQYLLSHPALNVKTKILVGYSGGGAIAVHLANVGLDVSHLVTLAGNLDHSRWTVHHRFSPLVSSLNAADIKVAPTIIQQHFIGVKDKNITVDINKRFYKHNQLTPIIIKGYSHQCCWARDWEEIENTIMTATQ